MLIHMRGDITGALLFFTVLFLGFWQLVVAWKGLNGFSLTGYPDRRKLSFAVGLALVIGACGWYFSRQGHFASPDIEGVETLVLLAVGFLAATVVQVVLASVAFRRRYRRFPSEGEEAEKRLEDVTVTVEGTPVPALFGLPAGGEPTGGGVLLLHDYGGKKEDTNRIAAYLRARGHATLAVDLDGHGENPRGVSSPAMVALMNEATTLLKDRTGKNEVSVVGIGLGGTLAVRLAAADASACRAVAIDPPTTEDGGWPSVNALRELKPIDLAAGFLRPAARGGEGVRMSLSRMLVLMPPAGAGRNGVTVIGTEGTWFNSPAALRGYSKQHELGRPVLLPGRHVSIAFGENTLEVISRICGSLNP